MLACVYSKTHGKLNTVNVFINMEIKRDKKLMYETYQGYYNQGYSFRDNWFGEINRKYIMPKYFNLLDKFINSKNKMVSILELGAGDGEVTDIISKLRPKWDIIPTEFNKAGVSALIKKGYKQAKIVNAIDIPFKDRSFDFVICFDVMHHIEGPAKMAYEMLRVTRRGVFLIEANRQSMIRRILEKTIVYKKAGEFSYYPIEYRSFFNYPNVFSIDITPFQFIPPKRLNFNIDFTIWLSEIISKMPLLKWQCSGLAIEVKKR